MNECAHSKKEVSLKYICLVLLVVQNTLLVLIGKYSTIIAADEKFLTCSVVIMVEVSVPSFLYVIQNNLILVALDKLPAAIFQVSYQLKILTTALMSVAMLKRKLSYRQWISLFILFIGVILVNIKPKAESVVNSQSSELDSLSNRIIGLSAVVVSSLTSAFSGVYFERLLKNENADLLISNIQLSMTGILIGMVAAFFSNYSAIYDKGFFVGYNIFVWIYILFQALGGFLIGFVVKYADNILKGFATSVAIVLSAVVSYFLFSFNITALFSIGASLVISSIIIYSFG